VTDMSRQTWSPSLLPSWTNKGLLSARQLSGSAPVLPYCRTVTLPKRESSLKLFSRKITGGSCSLAS
jgi:hypothetical protein